MMFLKLACLSFAVLVCVSQMPAQTAGDVGPAVAPAGPTGDELVAQRLQFAQAMYKLDRDQTAKLRATLTPLLPAQQRYEADIALTLHRLLVARSVVAADTTLTWASRARMAARFERQYHHTNARAPLSFANVMKRVEAMLPQDQIAEGRARIKAKFADHFEGDDAQPDIEKEIDALLADPLPSLEYPGKLGPLPTSPDAPIPADAPTRDWKLARVPAAETQPPKASASESPERETPPSVKQRSYPDPVHPKPLDSLPPESQWARYIDATATRFRFTDQQKQKADTILESCLSRAASYRRQLKTNDKAAAPEEKTPKLDERLSNLYRELTQRVDSLVSVEQKQAVEGVAPPKRKPSDVRAPRRTPARPRPADATPPKPLEPAPPESQWADYLETSSAKFSFSGPQKDAAAAIVSSCRSRAAAHREKHKAAYEEAKNIADPAKKAEAIRRLNSRLDVLYNELTQRVDSLVSVEQKQKAEAARKPQARKKEPQKTRGPKN